MSVEDDPQIIVILELVIKEKIKVTRDHVFLL